MPVVVFVVIKVTNEGEMKILNAAPVAMAALMVVLQPQVANAGSLDGAYVGVQAGALFGATELTYTDGTDTATADGISTDGAVGGVFAGYGKVYDSNFYAGAQLDLSLSSADTSASVNNSSGSLEVDNVITAGARLGYMFTPDTLFYGRIAYSRLEWSASTNNGLSASDEENGLSIGAGLEAGITDSLSLRTELLFTNYEDTTVTSGNESLTIDPTSLSATIGLAYLF